MGERGKVGNGGGLMQVVSLGFTDVRVESEREGAWRDRLW